MNDYNGVFIVNLCHDTSCCDAQTSACTRPLQLCFLLCVVDTEEQSVA